MNKVQRLALRLSPILFLFLFAGCKSHEKVFQVTSYPSGATIFVDGKQRGLTDMEKLSVTFSSKPLATIRLEKDGFQSDGINVSMESPEVLSFFLQESPNNKKIIEELKKIQQVLERLLDQAKRTSEKSST